MVVKVGKSRLPRNTSSDWFGTDKRCGPWVTIAIITVVRTLVRRGKNARIRLICEAQVNHQGLWVTRPWRIEYARALYHVSSRRNERRPIVADDEGRRRFLEILGRCAAATKWRSSLCFDGQSLSTVAAYLRAKEKEILHRQFLTCCFEL